MRWFVAIRKAPSRFLFDRIVGQMNKLPADSDSQEELIVANRQWLLKW
jgi:hypothetical protein